MYRFWTVLSSFCNFMSLSQERWWRKRAAWCRRQRISRRPLITAGREPVSQAERTEPQ